MFRRIMMGKNKDVTNGLITHLKFENDFVDSTGNRAFEMTGNVTFDKMNGKIKCAVFDGGSYLYSPTNLTAGTSDFAYCAWVDSHQDSNGSYRTVFEEGHWPNTAISLRQQEQNMFSSFSTGVEPLIQTPGFIPNQWFFVVVQRHNGQFQHWINGVLVNIVDSQLNTTPQSGITIGTSNHSKNQYFSGGIASFRTYNRALTEEEINKIYNLEGPADILNTCILTINLKDKYGHKPKGIINVPGIGRAENVNTANFVVPKDKIIAFDITPTHSYAYTIDTWDISMGSTATISLQPLTTLKYVDSYGQQTNSPSNPSSLEGVVVWFGVHNFIIGKKQSNKPYGVGPSINNNNPNVLNGFERTESAMSAAASSTAFKWVRNANNNLYINSTYKNTAYIGSYNEMKIIYDALTQINEKLTAIGAQKIGAKNYWTASIPSVGSSDANAIDMSTGYVRVVSKTTSTTVLPLTRYIPVDQL